MLNGTLIVTMPTARPWRLYVANHLYYRNDEILYAYDKCNRSIVIIIWRRLIYYIYICFVTRIYLRFFQYICIHECRQIDAIFF